MVSKITFEIESKQDIKDLVDKIVEQSNNITDEDLKKVPEQYRDFFKSIINNIVFSSRHNKHKHYIDVIVPFNIGKGKYIFDRVLGLSSGLKRIFKECKVDAKIKLV
jgi:hypothetical protein